MKRRELLAMAGSAGICPSLAMAQPKAMPLIGVLMLGSPEDALFQTRLRAFYKALDVAGQTLNRTVAVEVRWAVGDAAALERGAAELVALKPDVIVANGTPSVVALKKATRSIPIVCALVQDPVRLGLVASLARPGGNITGFSYINPELLGKWRGLLAEVAPSTRKAGLLFNPTLNSQYFDYVRDLGPAPQGEIDIIATPLQAIEALRAEMAELGKAGGGAVIVPADSWVLSNFDEVVSLALRYRLPSLSVYSTFVTKGGLMSYGPDDTEIFRRAASYVDRILRGASPAELPVQQPDKFEFRINLKTAKALGLVVPPFLLALADEVIE